MPKPITLLLLFCLLSGCTPPAELDQQLYIWQRQWRPSHAEALQQTRKTFSQLRVLALQYHPQAGWSAARPDLALLRADGRPLVAVVRLDGRLPEQPAEVIRRSLALLDDWRRAGLPLVGLELDHDAGTAQLAHYRQLLTALHQQLPKGIRLSITALPAWLDSPELPALLGSVQQSVLQVHAVQRASQGLFDAAQARQWAERWSRQSQTPFLLALPAYSVALLDEAGRRPLIEAEAPLDNRAPRRELRSDPHAMALLLRQLREQPPPHLQGLIWFRLPLADDRRSWPLATLLAVARGEALQPQGELQVHSENGLSQLSLYNRGNLPWLLPTRLQLPASQCSAADGLRHFHLQREPTQLLFIRKQPAELRPGSRLALGWARCAVINQGGWNAQP
ncbi:hypothetical protein HNP49_000241 [Pseudomonas fluvialis]|uniref:DUF3142 domain-containing protein n=1 Tax=Pseudomonas fluvialis TaxID=1793966 RepID=A0A7X0BR92_9PSED|nr:DUF3142 domain-containing protein [Pseudomonas fluvialis]MBB6340091.1 hypothetical protein [Pseudomonas fluvialis]